LPGGPADVSTGPEANAAWGGGKWEKVKGWETSKVGSVPERKLSGRKLKGETVAREV